MKGEKGERGNWRGRSLPSLSTSFFSFQSYFLLFSFLSVFFLFPSTFLSFLFFFLIRIGQDKGELLREVGEGKGEEGGKRKIEGALERIG